MNSNDCQFSLIQAEPGNKNSLDFSLGGLLEEDAGVEEVEEKSIRVEVPENLIEEGSFMRGLHKMEKSLSYESNPYNIFEHSWYQGEQTHTLEIKQEETCGRSINNTKGTSHTFEKPAQSGLCYLIVDFKEETQNSNVQEPTNLHDYYGSDILEMKKSLLRPTEQSLHFQRNQLIDEKQTVTEIQKKGGKTSRRKESQHSNSKSSRNPNSTNKRIRPHESKSQRQTTKKKITSVKKNKPQKKAQPVKMKQSPSKKEQAYHQYFGFSEKMPQFKKCRSKEKKSAPKKRKVILSQKYLKTNI